MRVIALVLTLSLGFVRSAFGDTLIDFEDLTPGANATTKYQAQGVVFDTQGWVPYGVQVPLGATRSGTSVASITCRPDCSAEFPLGSTRGIFVGATHRYVSVYVGGYQERKGSVATAVVTLTAYDSAGAVVGQTTSAPFRLLFGVRTFLEVRSATPNIASFVISARPETDPNKYIAIDDLSFDTPAPQPSDFALSVAPEVATVTQGRATKAAVTINRLNGSTGGVRLSALNLPSGVTASFDPETVDGGASVLTLTANEYAAPNSAAQPITINAEPLTSSVGPAPRTTALYLNVRSNFFVSPLSKFARGSVSGCAKLEVPIKVVRDPSFTGSVTLAVQSVPAGISAVVSPNSIDWKSGNLQQDGIVTFAAALATGIPANTSTLGKALVIATSPGYSQSEFPIDLSVGGAQITSFSPASGSTPRELKPGTMITITGKGFCPQTIIQFGNNYARVSPAAVNDEGTEIKASVPRFAMTGPLAIASTIDTTVNANIKSADEFTVHSYRLDEGWQFHNLSKMPVTFDDVEDLFGYDQTHLAVDFCWPFGCNVPTPVPSPLAAVFMEIARAALNDGQCFGMSLSSQRILHGDKEMSKFPPPGAALVSQLIYTSDTAHYIHVQHIAQLSSEFVHHYIGEASQFSYSTSGTVREKVRSALLSGDHPYISLRNGGSGHVVVAYNIEDIGPGGADGFYIDLYDPNFEIAPIEINDEEGSQHAYREGFTDASGTEFGSRIHVFANGHWLLPHANYKDPWTGGLDTIVVTDYSVVPIEPTMPASFKGLLTVIFGDAAKTDQIADNSGHHLLNTRGEINRDPATALPNATRFAAFEDPESDNDVYGLQGEGPFVQTISGKAPGQYTNAAIAWDGTTKLTTAASNGAADEITRRAGLAGLSYRSQKSGKAYAAGVIATAPDQSQRSVVLSAQSSTEADTIAFDARRESVAFDHAGSDGTFSFSLAWMGKSGPPVSMTSGNIAIRRGERATIAPSDWSALNSTSTEVRISGPRGKPRSVTMKPAQQNRVTLTALDGSRGADGLVHLVIDSAISGSIASGDLLVIAWNLLRDGRSIARHTAQIPAVELKAGARSDEWIVQEKLGGSVEFAARVVLIKSGDMPTSWSAKKSRQITLD